MIVKGLAQGLNNHRLAVMSAELVLFGLLVQDFVWEALAWTMCFAFYCNCNLTLQNKMIFQNLFCNISNVYVLKL